MIVITSERSLNLESYYPIISNSYSSSRIGVECRNNASLYIAFIVINLTLLFIIIEPIIQIRNKYFWLWLYNELIYRCVQNL